MLLSMLQKCHYGPHTFIDLKNFFGTFFCQNSCSRERHVNGRCWICCNYQFIHSWVDQMSTCRKVRSHLFQKNIKKGTFWVLINLWNILFIMSNFTDFIFVLQFTLNVHFEVFKNQPSETVFNFTMVATS